MRVGDLVAALSALPPDDIVVVEVAQWNDDGRRVDLTRGIVHVKRINSFLSLPNPVVVIITKAPP